MDVFIPFGPYLNRIPPLLLTFTFGFATQTYAHIGNVGLDSSSFFYKSNDRGTEATTFAASTEGDFHTRALEGKGDLSFYTFVDHKPELGINPKELYLSTASGALGGSQFTLGRKIFEWSKVDHTWNMMSLWSPRFTWDLVHPETVGMTGAFYEFKNKHAQFIFYASPISIPEMGTPTSESNHQIVSPNPLYVPPPSTLTVEGVPTHISYSLVVPSTRDILLRPNAAAKLKLQNEDGFWVSAGAGLLPINMIQMAAEPYLDTSSGTGDLHVNIRPQFPMRTITTIESGFDSPEKDWDLWFSGSYERPFQFQNKSNWLNPIITPTGILSAGSDVELTSNFWFNGGILFVREEPFHSTSTLTNVNVNLPSRFPIKQGMIIGGSWYFSDQTQSKASWTQDLVAQSHFVSLDFQHTFRTANLTVGTGADLFFTDTTSGWVGQYYGNDRIRGWMKYAF